MRSILLIMWTALQSFMLRDNNNENEHATAFWDVPLFADTTQVVKPNRIDATVIDKTSKQVRVIEMSCPWLENREGNEV